MFRRTARQERQDCFCGGRHDWPLCSLHRVWVALKHFVWFIAVPDEPVYLPLRRLLLYDNRPHACAVAEARDSWWAGARKTPQ